MKKFIWFIALLGSIIGALLAWLALKAGRDFGPAVALAGLTLSVSTFLIAKSGSEILDRKS